MARLILRLTVVLALVWLIKLGIDALFAKLAVLETDAAARAMTGMLITVLLGYALLLAVPFVPGVEIGIAILVLEGASAAPLVYGATVLGLLIAFGVGQFAPMPRLIAICQDLSLHRIAGLLERIEDTPREDRLNAMHSRLPRWLAAVLCDYRYVALGVAINMPGNIALGGGGGIMLAAGLSRLFHSGLIFGTIAIATLPVPLGVWFLGRGILQ
ncbi:MAG: hypothetical protein ACSHW1_14165 [Yoonia sp.]|uniref:hypothetical protein n=1 Tax=Yoonia sp. TaxID=2212373 RepID=UPI003EF2C215